ncbi:MAG: hypothetical protein KA715_06065 [Xanthomonadaceae bacterium]|nr:hypothetical protein [Xanthomonadaceae bacterium]
MNFRKLKTEEELKVFQKGFFDNFQKRGGEATSDIPIDYLQRSKVTGVFNSKGKMVAGYVIGTRTPFRLLDFVPHDKRVKLIPPFHAKWSDCCEITCVWKTRGVSSVFMSAILWPRVNLGVLFSKKRVLFGHDQNPKLDHFYTQGGPLTIYKGESSYGLPSRLFAFNRPRLVIGLFAVLFFITPKRIIKQFVRRVQRIAG